MKKIKCEDCGLIFDETEINHVYDSYFHMYVGVCPSCKSDELIDVDECKNCGKYEDTTFMNYGLCAECQQKAINKFKYFILNNFNDAEIDFISSGDFWY